MALVTRCSWVNNDPLYIEYHDTEWGMPVHDDRTLFEMLNLEGAQAGLSWYTVLKKRAHYRKVFDNFDPEKIIHYDNEKVEKLLADPGIIRNRLKVNAVITNAKAYFKVLNTYKSFNEYIWQFVNHEPIINNWTHISEVPVTTPISDAMSQRLKKDGFKFIGSTICYAYMQACGLVNDHTIDCFCHPNFKTDQKQHKH